MRARGNRSVREAEEGVTVGFYAPLPPARTGVAEHASALLAALRRHGRVEIAPPRCDVALYHLGNNPLHAEIYRRALERPGLVVLHDAVLHHFLLGTLDQARYVDEFAYNYGEWNRGLAETLWRERAGSASDARYFRFPMLRRAVERARAVVVHNPAAARAVREHGGAALEIPLLHAGPESVDAAAAERWRQSLGIPTGTFVFGIFGYLRESKRVIPVLETFARLHRENPRTALLVAGSFVSSDLQRAAAPWLAAEGIVRAPYLEEHAFHLAAGAVDACINLRDPSAGETSAITIQFMALGKPVLVTASEECARFPEDACLRVAPGIEERDSLWEHMVLLTSVPGMAHAVGSRGAAHIRARHRIELIAQQYWDMLCEYRC